MIERGHRLFGHFPPDRLLNVRFEEVQVEPEVQIRRLIRFIDPSLEDEGCCLKWPVFRSLPHPVSNG